MRYNFHTLTKGSAKTIEPITEQLLALEAAAHEAMNAIARENAELTRRAQEQLAEKLSDIESEGAESIRRVVKEAESHTAERIERVKEEYHAKTDAFERDFYANRKNLRGKIFHDVLYGES